MRALWLALVGVGLLAAGGLVGGEEATKAPGISAQDKAREIIRLTGELSALFDQKKHEEAAAVCRKMIELVPHAPEPHYNLACALAHLDKKDEALASLAKAAEIGFNDVATMEKDADLAGLRDDKRYTDALTRVKANDAARVEKGDEIPGVKALEGQPEGGLAYRLRMGPAATREKPNRLILWMHPAGGSMNQQVEALAPRFLQRGFALLVFTKKDFRFWSADDAVRLGKALEAVAKVEGISDDRPVLMGYSAGGQMALELYAANPEGLGGLVLDAAYPVRMMPGGKVSPMPLPASELGRKVPMFVVVGTKDGGSQVWKAVEADYRQRGVPLTVRYIEGQGHTWLFGSEELDALDQWLGTAAAAPATGKAGWRPGAPGSGELAVPSGLVKFAEGQDSITVPVECGGHLLFAKVKLNGQDAGWFVVDTGGQMTMISSATAAALNLPVTGQGALQGLGGGARPVAFRRVDALSVGDLAVGPHSVIDQDLKVLSGPLGLEIGGVLGATLWSQVPFTVDYDARTITFHNPARFKPPAGAKADKLEIVGTRPTVRGLLGGKHEGVFALDTAGTRFLFLGAAFVNENPDLFEAGPVRTITSVGATGQGRLGLRDLKSLTVLGQTFTGVQVQYPLTEGGGGEKSSAGTLGAPLMERFRITFDYANKQIYAEPRKVLSMRERLAKGLKVGDRDLIGCTPLQMAANDGRKADVEVLLAARADPNAADNIGRTPLHAAASSGEAEIVKRLLAKGADVKAKTKDGATPLYIAVQNDQTEAARALLAVKADANVADSSGMTALMWAALNANTDLVKALLGAAADVAARKDDGKTVLMAAAQTDNAQVVRALVEAKADVNVQDKQGGTALMYAAFMNRAAVVEALIAAKADVNLKTTAGESALKIAKARRLQAIVGLLEKAGATE